MKLGKFKPVIGMCSQGQRKDGVNDGGLFLYNNVFRNLCDSKPYIVQNSHFDNHQGYIQLYQTLERLNKPILLGGDRSIVSSSVFASLRKFPDLQVIWMGAYPDLNTYKSSKTGNTHGSALAVCTGLENEHWASRMNVKTLNFDQVSLVGIRGEIDEAEQNIIRDKKIRKFESVQKLIKFMDEKKAPVHISFDVSALDPEVLNSTGDLEPGGMET